MTTDIGYTSGSYYKRFKTSGLIQSRNMKAMNREAAESVNSAYLNTGTQVFESRATEALGRSELAAQQVLKRAQDLMNNLAEQGESVSAANGGAGSSLNISA
jgi:hypothetical protein